MIEDPSADAAGSTSMLVQESEGLASTASTTEAKVQVMRILTRRAAFESAALKTHSFMAHFLSICIDKRKTPPPPEPNRATRARVNQQQSLPGLSQQQQLEQTDIQFNLSHQILMMKEDMNSLTRSL